MAGSEGKKELGGLARSIDALFSASRPTHESTEPEEIEIDVSGALQSESTGHEPKPALGPAQEAEGLLESEPVVGPEILTDRETVEEAEFRAAGDAIADHGAVLEPEASSESESDATVAEVVEEAAAPDDLAPTMAAPPPLPAEPGPSDSEADALASLDEIGVTPAFATGGEVEAPAEPDAGSSEPTATVEEAVDRGPTPKGLTEAVEAFLSGSPGATDEVEAIADALRERLALDPLADAVERLVEAAGEPPDPGILEVARSIINPAVASRLVQRMGRERDEERLAGNRRMCQHLGRIMANAFRGALTDSTEEHARRVYCDALIAMGDTSRPVIEEMIDDDNRFLVLNAVAILGEIGGSRAVELVTSALADTDPRVRREALLSLGKLGDEEAGRLVLGSFEDADRSVRVAAAVAAGDLGLERALRPILGMLGEEDEPEICISLLRALGQIGDPGAVQSIEKHAVGGLFSKPRTDVRVAAYRALHEIGTPHARQLLEQARSDKDRGVQIVVRDLVTDD